MDLRDNNLEANGVNASLHKASIFFRWQESNVKNITTSIKIFISALVYFVFVALSQMDNSPRTETEKFLLLLILFPPFCLAFLYTVSGYFALSEQMSVSIKRVLLKTFTFLFGCFQIFWILGIVLDIFL